MKNIILDVGGVQVWPRVGHWHIPLRMAKILGGRADTMRTDAFAAAHQTAMERWLDESQHVRGVAEERRLRAGFIEEMNARMNWRLSTAEMLELIDDFTDNMDRYGFYDDVVPWLRQWKGRYGLGVLSDAMPSIIVFLNRHGSGELFDHMVISTQVGAVKPDPRMYRAAVDAFHARPEDCLFVDDNPANVEAAVALGLRGAQMARSEFMPARFWDGPVVRDFAELNALLEAGSIF